ncbi:Purine nucleoside phosphorylase DeoD-type [Nymphon striatum]|nr:Purine nucleoside phosphorylase DeoD-type [Nymphon striatum]
MTASTLSTPSRGIFKELNFAPCADWSLLRAAVAASEGKGTTTHVGGIYSSDVFYDERPDLNEQMVRHGILGVEMEAAELYILAARHGVRALAVLTVSDHLLTHEALPSEDRERSFGDMRGKIGRSGQLRGKVRRADRKDQIIRDDVTASAMENRQIKWFAGQDWAVFPARSPTRSHQEVPARNAGRRGDSHSCAIAGKAAMWISPGLASAAQRLHRLAHLVKGGNQGAVGLGADIGQA